MMLQRVLVLYTLYLVMALCFVNALPTSIDSNQPITRIAFGSCNKQYLDQPLWPLIHAFQPDVWIWAGDTIYSDSVVDHIDQLFGNVRGYHHAYTKKQYDLQKSNAGYQLLLNSSTTTTQIVGVWDDHDYGYNDGDHTHPARDDAQRLLLNFLDEPEDSMRRQQKGVYATYVWGPLGQRVRVILLDVRYHQNKDTQDLLGDEQWSWFENTLATNDANLTLIVSGIQILQHGKPFSEGWKYFPHSRTRLLKMLMAHEATTSFFLLSGDVHLGEFTYTSVMRPDNESVFTIYEMTSSGMTHSWQGEWKTLHGLLTFSDTLVHWWNTYIMNPWIIRRRGILYDEASYDSLNFGTLEINWNTSKLRTSIHGVDGGIHLQHMWSINELNPSSLKSFVTEAEAETDFQLYYKPFHGNLLLLNLVKSFVFVCLVYTLTHACGCHRR